MKQSLCVLLLACFLAWTVAGMCPPNSTPASGLVEQFCVCNSGYTCNPQGTGFFCGAYMNGDRVGFSANCPYCQCVASGAPQVPSISGAWTIQQDSTCMGKYDIATQTTAYVQQFGSAVSFTASNLQLNGQITGGTLTISSQYYSTTSCSLSYSAPNTLSGSCQASTGTCTLSMTRSSSQLSGSAYNSPPVVGGTYRVTQTMCGSLTLPSSIAIFQQQSFIGATFDIAGPVTSGGNVNYFGLGALDSFGFLSLSAFSPLYPVSIICGGTALSGSSIALSCTTTSFTSPTPTTCPVTLTCTAGSCLGSGVNTVSGLYTVTAHSSSDCSLEGGTLLQMGSSVSYFDGGGTLFLGTVGNGNLRGVSFLAAGGIGSFGFCTGTITGGSVSGTCTTPIPSQSSATCSFTLKCAGGACSGVQGEAHIAGSYVSPSNVPSTCPITTAATTQFSITQRGNTFELDPRGVGSHTSIAGYVDEYGLFLFVQNAIARCVGFVSGGTMTANCLLPGSTLNTCSATYTCSSGQCLVLPSNVGAIVGGVVGAAAGVTIIVVIVLVVLRRQGGSRAMDAQTAFRQM